MSKLLIIDRDIPDISLFIESISPDVSSMIVESYAMTQENEEYIMERPRNHIGFVWDMNRIEHIPFYRDIDNVYDSGVGYPEKFVNILHKVNTLAETITVDLITCDLNSPQFVNYTKQVEEEISGLTIRYSIDKTGNIENGGDWILESHGENIKHEWFNENIENYKHLLGNVFSTGSNIFLLIKNKLYGCGSNQFGTLGIGNTSFYSSFIPITNLDVEFVASGTITFVKLTDGRIYACGDHRPSSATGQGYGKSTFTDTTTLTLLNSSIDPSIVNINPGYWVTVAQTSDGKFYFSGRFSQDTGTTTNLSARNFTEITPLTAYANDQIRGGIKKHVYVEAATYILFNNGELIGIGLNLFGDLNQGNTNQSRLTFVTIESSGVDDMFSGSDALAVFVKYTNGSVKCCGWNQHGKLGINSSSTSITTLQNHPLPDISTITGDSLNTYFLTNSGDLYGSGRNERGQLNDGTTASNSGTVLIDTNVRFFQMVVQGILYIKHDGTIGGTGNLLTQSISSLNVSSNSSATIGSIPHILDLEGATIDDIQQFGNHSIDFTYGAPLPQYDTIENARLYIPIDNRFYYTLFNVDNGSLYVNESVARTCIIDSFNKRIGSDYELTDDDISDFDTTKYITLHLFFDNLKTILNNKVINRIIADIGDQVYNTSDNQSLFRSLRFVIGSKIKGLFLDKLVDENDIVINNDSDDIINALGALGTIENDRIYTDLNSSIAIQVRIKYDGRFTVVIPNSEDISAFASEELLLNNQDFPFNRISYNDNSDGIDYEDGQLRLNVLFYSVRPGFGSNIELLSDNLLYYIDPGSRYSNQGTGQFINLGSENISTSVVGYSDGDTSNSLVVSGSSASGIQLGSIRGIRTISIFCKFPSVYVNKHYLLDARLGATNGYIWIAGEDVGMFWRTSKLYVNGGIESQMVNDTLALVSHSNDRWVHITIVANENFSDDVTFFNSFSNNEPADVEFGVIKMFNREITEEENRSVFLDHYRYYDIPIQDEIRDGLVFYIDPMNPRSYTSGSLTMTNLVNSGIQTNFRGSTNDYSLSVGDFGLEILDRANAGIDVGSITGIRTISIWVKVLSTSTHSNYLLDARTGDGNGFIVESPTGNQIGTLWFNCSYYLNGSLGTLTNSALSTIMDHNDQWRHIVLLANRDFTDDVTLFSRYTNIFAETAFCRFGPVKMFDRLITETEVLSLYNEFGSRYGK